MKKQTQAIHTQFQRRDAYNSLSMPVYHTAAYEFDNADDNGIIRVDYIITHTTDENGKERERINMLEVNTTPGMTATSFIPQQVRAAGMDMKDVLTDIIENKLS